MIYIKPDPKLTNKKDTDQLNNIVLKHLTTN